MNNNFKAPQDGHYLAMSTSRNNGSFQSIAIHWSEHMKAGDIKPYPVGSIILMVMPSTVWESSN